MDSLVSQPGEPLLTFSKPEGATVQVSQQRFFLNPAESTPGKELWTIPVCFKTGSAPQCDVLNSATQQLAIPSKSVFFADADGKGYYRTAYPKGVYHEMIPHVESDLTPEERVSLLGDQWALTRSGKSTVSDYLDLVESVRKDESPAVVSSVSGSLASIYSRVAATPEERTKLAAWVTKQFSPALEAIGEPQASDSPSRRELRAELLTLVGGLGRDGKAIAEAKSITERSLADPTSVDATLSEAALPVAARNGDAALFDKLQKLSVDAANPQIRENALHGLALFRDPALETRALDYAVSGKVRNQDAAGFIAAELRSTDTRELAWKYIQDNWSKVSAQFTTFSGSYVVGSAGAFCSQDKLTEVDGFFATHKVAASERTLARAKDQIGDCIALRAAQGPSLQTWLGTK